MRTRIVYYGANGAGRNYDIRRWALMDGSEMSEIAGGLDELYELFPNAHFYFVAHSWGAAVVLYFLREMCTDGMRFRSLLIPIAGLCWLPEGTRSDGLVDFLAGKSFDRVRVVPIFSSRDGVIPPAVANPREARGYSVPVGGKQRDVHNRILKEEVTANRGWFIIFGDVDERTSLERVRERRRLVSLSVA
jgi:pimeloyl-ACP methyl ester carboxylesterase